MAEAELPTGQGDEALAGEFRMHLLTGRAVERGVGLLGMGEHEGEAAGLEVLLRKARMPLRRARFRPSRLKCTNWLIVGVAGEPWVPRVGPVREPPPEVGSAAPHRHDAILVGRRAACTAGRATAFGSQPT